MASEHFSLCWDNFHKNMSTGMQSLLETEDLVDVTLAVEGRYLKAHKMLLSVCSPYFRQLFQSNPCQHPIVFMKDVSYVALTDLLQFMYQGEVQVAQENLSMFIKTAEALQIKGLTPENKVQIESETDQQIEKPVEEATEKRSHDSNEQKTCDSSQSKALLGPTSKRPKYCNFTTISTPASDSTQTATAENKYELSSVNTYNVVPCDEVNLKLEPIQTDTADECQLEQYDDETNVFKMDNEMEDFSLMESENDEPNPGTSTEDGDNQASFQNIFYENDCSDEDSKPERYSEDFSNYSDVMSDQFAPSTSRSSKHQYDQGKRKIPKTVVVLNEISAQEKTYINSNNVKNNNLILLGEYDNSLTDNLDTLTHTGQNLDDYKVPNSLCKIPTTNTSDPIETSLDNNEIKKTINHQNLKTNSSVSKRKSVVSSLHDKNYKKTFCTFCGGEINSKHFARHLESRHKNEKKIIELFKFKKNDPERKKLLTLIRNDGNLAAGFRGHIIPKRRVLGQQADQNTYIVCTHCKSYIKNKYLRRHEKRCFANTKIDRGRSHTL